MESVLLNVFLHVISPTSWIVLIPNRHFFPVCQVAEPTPRKSFDKGVNLEVLRLVVFVIPTEESNFLGACTVYYCFVSWYTYTLAKRTTLVSRWFLVGLLLLGSGYILGLILREISDISRYFPRRIWREISAT